MEEKKLDALNDEALDKVSGGMGHESRMYWCPKCKQNRQFLKFKGTIICSVCCGTEHEPKH